MEIFKFIEIELQRKGLIQYSPSDSIHPLWFLVETERNVYLWQKGFSLSDMDLFEFWVDVPALIVKRTYQLSNSGLVGNPFLNPGWGGIDHDALSENAHEQEILYMERFLNLFQQIASHANALSQVGSMLRHELAGESRPKIILPTRRPSSARAPALDE